MIDWLAGWRPHVGGVGGVAQESKLFIYVYDHWIDGRDAVCVFWNPLLTYLLSSFCTRRLHISNGHRRDVIPFPSSAHRRVPIIYFRVDKSPSFRGGWNLWGDADDTNWCALRSILIPLMLSFDFAHHHHPGNVENRLNYVGVLIKHISVLIWSLFYHLSWDQ